MTISQDRVPIGLGAPTRDVPRTTAMLGTSILVALGIVIATAYAFVASDPYRSLPDASVLAARGQDVVSVLVAGAALLGGLLRLTTLQWPDTASTRLRRGTGWMLTVVAVMFTGLWLSVLLPFALGGSAPSP